MFGFEVGIEAPNTVGPKGTFLENFYQPFLSVLLAVYHPLYILPLFLSGYLATRRKLLLEILSILLSVFFFFPYFGLWALTIGHGGNELSRLSFPAFGAQIVFSLILGAIFYYKKEKIIKKLMFVSLVFFLVAVAYITFSAKIASGAKMAIESLTQETIDAGDVSLCENILEEGKKLKVYSGTLVSRAYKKCINSIAFALGDESICDLYSEYNAECHKKIFLEKTNLCKEVPQSEKVKCIQEIAIETNDIELCKKILGGVKCIAPIAVNIKNLNLCFPEEIDYPLPAEPNPHTCFEEVFKHTNDVNLCKGLKKEVYKDGCLSKAAVQSANLQQCEEVGQNDYQYTCYNGPNTPPHACLPDMDKRQCFLEFFRKSKDSQACQEIKEGVNRDVCYYAAVAELGDNSLCDQIQEKTWKEWCLTGFGP